MSGRRFLTIMGVFVLLVVALIVATLLANKKRPAAPTPTPTPSATPAGIYSLDDAYAAVGRLDAIDFDHWQDLLNQNAEDLKAIGAQG